MVKLKVKPVDMCIIQVYIYMPTMEHSEEEVEDMYEKIEQRLDDEHGWEILMLLWEKR